MDEATTTKKSSKAGWIAALVLYLLLPAIYLSYDFIDGRGYVFHEVETSISASGNWLVGETKDCTSYPLGEQAAHIAEANTGYSLNPVRCDDGPNHAAKVRFYGRKVQKEYEMVGWRCTRNSADLRSGYAFTCKESYAR